MVNRTLVEFKFTKSVYEELYDILIKYCDNEIGGMLAGKKLNKNEFLISNITVADDVGIFNPGEFIREPKKSIRKLKNLYRRNRSNYIGEWHSHPNYSLNPSIIDIDTMNGIIFDENYDVSFALLLIVKLNNNAVKMAGYLFHKNLDHFIPAQVTESSVG